MSSDKSNTWSNNFWNCCAAGFVGCLCGFCCPACYMANARTKHDHSNCCFNLSCIGSGIIRDIVRDGYNIDGSCEAFKCCCPPCNAIQVNAEVTKRGSKPPPDVNKNQWSNSLFNCCSGGCGECCSACCCLSCYWAQTRTLYDHSSCLSNYCCLGSPGVRNIVREGLGIKGTCVGDICMACCCPLCAAIQVNSEVKANRTTQKLCAEIQVNTQVNANRTTEI